MAFIRLFQYREKDVYLSSDIDKRASRDCGVRIRGASACEEKTGDGASQPDELLGLEEAGVTQMNLGYSTAMASH